MVRVRQMTEYLVGCELRTAFEVVEELTIGVVA